MSRIPPRAPPARILVLTSGPLCRNPRPFKEAGALAAAGHDVTVLSVAQHARFEAYDRQLLRDAPFRKLTVDRVPDRPAARLLSFLERAAAAALRRARVQHPAILGPYHALLRLARAQKPDLLIAHNELPFCIAARLQAEGRPVAADVEDWYSQDLLPAERATRPLRLLARVEGDLLLRARHVTTTSHALATALADAYDAPKPAVLPNTFPLSPPPDLSLRASPPAIFWFSQTIGAGRGLEPFLAAWALTRRPSRVVLLGDVSAGFRATLLASLPPSHRPRLEFHPLVAPAELPRLIARHDLGLALEQSSIVNRDLTITNKIIQYLDAGLAVLATPTAGQREIFARDPGIGLLDDLSDPSALALRLDTLLSAPDRLAGMGAAARKLAEREYCWEKNAPALVALVARSLSPRP